MGSAGPVLPRRIVLSAHRYFFCPFWSKDNPQSKAQGTDDTEEKHVLKKTFTLTISRHPQQRVDKMEEEELPEVRCAGWRAPSEEVHRGVAEVRANLLPVHAHHQQQKQPTGETLIGGSHAQPSMGRAP